MTCASRAIARRLRNWSKEDIARGEGWQHLIAAEGAFEQWFRAGRDLDSPPELIPEHIRNVL